MLVASMQLQTGITNWPSAYDLILLNISSCSECLACEPVRVYFQSLSCVFLTSFIDFFWSISCFTYMHLWIAHADDQSEAEWGQMTVYVWRQTVAHENIGSFTTYRFDVSSKRPSSAMHFRKLLIALSTLVTYSSSWLCITHPFDTISHLSFRAIYTEDFSI